MILLRRAWLIALVVATALGGFGALVMRAQLFEPNGGLSPELYNEAFTIHSVAMIGAFLAALIAIPTLMLELDRRAVIAGGIAFAMWTGSTAYLLAAELEPAWMSEGPLRIALRALAVATALGVVQLLLALRANRERRHLYVAAGSIAALALVGIALARGGFPNRLYLASAATLVALPLVITSSTNVLVWIVAVPCLAMTWGTSAALEAIHVDVPLNDTLAVLAPLPALGGALACALVLALSKGRALPRGVQVAAVAFAVGTIGTSMAFLLLGLRGMPRRYMQYDPVFQPLQIVLGAAALVAFAGAATVIIMTTARRRSRAAAEAPEDPARRER